jgi:thioesterase domain-containing protein
VGETSIVSIEEMAHTYVDEVLLMGAQRRPVLAGWSLGGIVAMEVAVQLQERGEHLDGLVLIDADAEEEDDFEGDPAFWSSLSRQLLGEMGDEGEHRGTVISDYAHLRDSIARAVAEGHLPDRFGADWLDRRLAVYRSNYAAMKRYTAKRYDGRVVCIYSPGTASSTLERWRRQFGSRMSYHPIRTDHDRLLAEESAIDDIAKVVEAVWQESLDHKA